MMSVAALIVSIAALLFSVVAPLLTAIIKGKQDREMFNNEFELKHRHEAVENYLKTAGRCVFSADCQDFKDFAEASAEIFMYTPKSVWDEIRNLNRGISELSLIIDLRSKAIKKNELQKQYLSLCEKMSFFSRRSIDKKTKENRSRK